MFCELPLLHVPVALICRVAPGASNALVGVTAIEVSVAEFTVSPVVPVALAPP